jgi:hypothetical protein
LNNNIYWFDEDRHPEEGATIEVTYTQVVSDKIISAFISAWAQEMEEFVCNLVDVQNSHWIDYMEGVELDWTGALFQTPRLSGETDTVYRARLKGIVVNFVGGGTVQSIKNTVALLTGEEPEVHDGQFTNPEGFTTTEADSQVTLYKQTETYTKINESTPIVSITSISGTLASLPHVFVQGSDYDLYAESHVRWLFKAGLNDLGDIPDHNTNITINYVVEVADYRAATMRVDVNAEDIVGVNIQSIKTAIQGAKAAGVLFILNVDVSLSDTITVAENIFTASPDISGPHTDDTFTITEDFSIDVSMFVGGVDDWLIWDVGNWDEKDWAPDSNSIEVVTIDEDITFTIGP